MYRGARIIDIKHCCGLEERIDDRFVPVTTWPALHLCPSTFHLSPGNSAPQETSLNLGGLGG